MTRRSAAIGPFSPLLRGWAALTALVAVGALGLQYALLLQSPELSVGQATLRLLGYFTILSNIGVGMVCTARAAGVRAGAGAALPAAAVALYISITGLVYVLILQGLWQPRGLQRWADNGLHYAVPLMYLCGWLCGPHARLPWRSIGLALLFPAAYLGWALLLGRLTGHYPYPFLDLTALGGRQVAINALNVGAAFVAVAGVLWAIERRLARRRR